MTGPMRALVAMALLAIGFGAGHARAETILFVGNSFTFGANSPVWHYRADSVTDLNGEGVGGVPALFKRFTQEAGLDYDVSLETAPGQTLAFHFTQKKDRLDRAWDHVVLQEYSVLDPKRPGDPTQLGIYAGKIAAMLTARNPAVDIRLLAPWSRPDQTYLPSGHWHGQPIEKMGQDLESAYRGVDRANDAIDAVIPVGAAFNRAIAKGIADPNPYDGTSYGQVDLWSYDHYHASTHGYYLEALMAFGSITGRDPRTLGRDEKAAQELGLSPDQAAALQAVAYEVLARAD